ncbi:hypothetical protein IVB16_32070 [Bradyrhizobium sp. 183]|uniref:hypothetical protein n=1 Tax=unclassified Bradyrhizobium TaxID=2631580 RepID=UPI0020002FB2|nr:MULTISPECIES: hypothetical protein [unclassified Bradyrhizobium]UPJ79335.1 hypothetical protein IVB17_32070 [Bradyrhizobium sp. 184]UPJ87129.1 hypothetical protein IVB16_32070 [Bradyrhizobium sp. 183]
MADKLEEVYSHAGVPTRLRQIEIPRDDLRAIADETVKNFNFNPGLRSAEIRLGIRCDYWRQLTEARALVR